MRSVVGMNSSSFSPRPAALSLGGFGLVLLVLGMEPGASTLQSTSLLVVAVAAFCTSILLSRMPTPAPEPAGPEA